MKLSEWASRNGVHYQIAWQWAREGNMPVLVVKTGTGRYLVLEQPEARTGRGVVYCRVSSAGRRPDLGRHAGLSRVVENFCLELVRAALAQRDAEASYGVPEQDRTPVPWSAPKLEAAWRKAHPERYGWFTGSGLSSRVPKEACRVRAAGFKNFFDSRSGKRKGRKAGFPGWRKRRDGSRFRYDADRARPVGDRAVRLPGVGDVRTREDMSWLTRRLADGAARVTGTTVREQAGRWWVSFQIEIDRTGLNVRRIAPADAPACGVGLGVKTFATVVDDDGTITEIHAPKPLKTALRRLRKANKALARTQRGSANRKKAARKVAKVHLEYKTAWYGSRL